MCIDRSFEIEIRYVLSVFVLEVWLKSTCVIAMILKNAYLNLTYVNVCNVCCKLDDSCI